MVTFWKEIQLVWTKKWSSWFGEPRCKLGSKVVFSIVFHYFSLFSLFSRFCFHLFLKLKLCMNGRHFMDGGGNC
jgi:hypothetical protein